MNKSNQLLLAALVTGLLIGVYLLGQFAVLAVTLGVLAVMLVNCSTTRRVARAVESKRCELSKDFSALQYAFDQHSIVAITGADGLILQANDKFCEISGYTREELMGVDHRILNSGYHPKQFFEEMWRTISQGRIWRGEILNRAKDGSLYWVETTIVPFRDEKGDINKYISIRTDISQRKNYETRTHLLATAIDQSVDGVAVLDISGTVEYVNPAYLKIIGCSAEEVIGADIANSGVASTDSEFKQTFLEAFHQGRAWTGRCANVNKSGKSYEEELILTPIYNDKKELVKVVIGVRDITKEAMLEQQSRQSQKMQAIGTLAGGIAHDFNNILSAILGYADLTIEDLAEGSPGHGNLTQVINAAGRAKGLVQQILAFSRQSAYELQLLSPRTMTKEVMKLLRASIPGTVSIRENIRAEEVYVRMDPSQYHQVVMNLVVNAGHAIGEQSGTITVSLDKCVIDAKDEEIAQGNYVRLVVEDTGCGMTQEVQERVFDPFFTTKGVDEGTGMGLSAVHGIVKAHSGYIRLSSEPGKGTRFDVYFPLVDCGEKGTSEHGKSRQGSEQVLVVDDEEVQTELMQQMLNRHGYQVTTCNSGQTALDMFTSSPSTFDAVITDQNMPDIKGDELAEKMLTLRPDLPIILCTGYSQSIGPEEAKAMGIREYLMKPITANDLNNTVAKIFESRL